MHAEGLITPALGFYGSKIKEKKGKNLVPSPTGGRETGSLQRCDWPKVTLPTEEGAGSGPGSLCCMQWWAPAQAPPLDPREGPGEEGDHW